MFHLIYLDMITEATKMNFKKKEKVLVEEFQKYFSSLFSWFQ